MEDYQEPRQRKGIFFPLLLILLGLVLFFSNIGVLRGNAWDMGLRLWPVLLIAAGLDRLYRRGGGWVGATVLIALGTLFLLANLGYVLWDSWQLLSFFWPVLLIAVGLDIAIGRRSPWASLWGLLLGAGLVVGILWFASSMNASQLNHQAVAQALDGASSGEVRIEAVGGQVKLSPGAPAGQLLGGDVYLARSETLKTRYALNAGRAELRLESSGMGMAPLSGPASQLVWDLRFNAGLPLDIDSQLAMGQQEIDLRAAAVERLSLETALGRTILILPPAGELKGEISGAIGQVVVFLPPSAAVRLRTDTGIAAVDVPQDFRRENGALLSPAAAEKDASIELSLSQAIGSVRVEYYTP